MKFFVISDTHGHLDKVLAVYQRLKNVDAIIHLGDVHADASRLEQELEIPVISVKGNMDGAYGQDVHQVLDTEYGKILLTHGHMENVKTTLQTLYYKTLELECKAVLFGHTHKALFEQLEGIYLLNPGSLTSPADGSQGSYAILNTDADSFQASIVYYSAIQQPTSAASKPKVTGGFLRNLLNNSDRF